MATGDIVVTLGVDGATDVTFGVPCLDHYSRFVSREVDPAVYFDTVHMNAVGYAIKGANLTRMLISAAA
jgi:hypothetical protein